MGPKAWRSRTVRSKYLALSTDSDNHHQEIVMLRSSLTLAGLVAIGATAQAQQQQPTLNTSKKVPIAGPIRDAGIYHQATNTWTRRPNQADIGADVIYCNTLGTGYFYDLAGDTFIDEGRIPSTTSPTQTAGLNLSRPGCANSYTVDGVAFTYCTQDALGGTFQLAFYETYVPCATVIGGTPTGSVAIVGPGTPTNGTTSCWIITVDLDPAAGFVMQADGDGAFNGAITGPATGTPGANDRFGWSMASPLVSTFPEGPVGAGFLGFNTPDGTVWDSPVNYLEDGTGMGTADQFRVESGPFTPGCYFFGGGAELASFDLRLFADACAAPPPGVGFCFGDGTGLTCPTTPGCVGGPFFGIAGNGCGNSLFPTVGTNLAGTGSASISNDTVSLVATNTPNSSVLFFQGTVQAGTPAGNGTAFGDGKRCAGGTVIRLGTKTAAGNTTSYPQGGDLSVSVRGNVLAPGIRTYQAWYRNAAAFCTASTFNLSNGYQITWGA